MYADYIGSRIGNTNDLWSNVVQLGKLAKFSLPNQLSIVTTKIMFL